jgi:hypothetical protein
VLKGEALWLRDYFKFYHCTKEHKIAAYHTIVTHFSPAKSQTGNLTKRTQLGDGELQKTEFFGLGVLLQKNIALFSPQRLISCIFRHNAILED